MCIYKRYKVCTYYMCVYIHTIKKIVKRDMLTEFTLDELIRLFNRQNAKN